MKTIDDIEKEYESFELKSDFVKSKEDLIIFLLIGEEDTNVIEEDNLREIRQNNRARLAAQIRNFIFFLDEPEDLDFYDEDNKIIEEGTSLTLEYRELYSYLFQLIEEDNIKDIVKLIDFSTEYYGKHMEYLESRRDSLEMAQKGFAMYNYRYSDNRKVFREFVNKKLIELDKNKKLVKKV